MYRRIIPEQAGFTLLEIMVAVAVMAIAFTAVLSLHSRSVSMAGSADFFIKAPLIAGQVMGEWEMAQTTGQTGPDRAEVQGFPGYTYDLEDPAVVSEFLDAPDGQDDQVRLVRLTCTVHYEEFTYTADSLRLVSP